MNDSGHLGQELEALLSERIETIDQLQLLLLLHSLPGVHLAPAELAEKAHIPVDTATEALEALLGAGLVTRAGDEETAARYGYAPGDRELAMTVDGLVATWRRNPAAIVRLLAARAIERVRTAALHTFADAFVLGRKKDG